MFETRVSKPYFGWKISSVTEIGADIGRFNRCSCVQDYNVPEQVDNLVAQAQQAASWTLGNDVMLLEGTDFS